MSDYFDVSSCPLPFVIYFPSCGARNLSRSARHLQEYWSKALVAVQQHFSEFSAITLWRQALMIQRCPSCTKVKHFVAEHREQEAPEPGLIF